MLVTSIPAALLEQVYRHAVTCFPTECCGYLVGPRTGQSATEVIECRNAQTDGEHPTHPERGADAGFVIAGAELFAFARSLSTDLPARVVYHSHTNGRAYFSAVDRANALASDGRDGPGAGPVYLVEHLVIGVTADGVTEAAQFGWSAEARDFVELARWEIRR